MSSEIISSNQSNITILSKIVVATYKELKLPKEVEQVILEPDVLEPDGFNYVLDTNKAQIYGFLSRHDDFTDEQCIEQILDVFKVHANINFVYSDVVTTGPGFKQSAFFPSDLSLAQYFVLNCPIFFRRTNKKFDNNKSTTYFDDMIRHLASFSLGHHIPKFLYTTQKHTVTPELEIQNYGTSN